MDWLNKIYFQIPRFENFFGFFGKCIDKVQEKVMVRMLPKLMPAYYRKTAHQWANGLNTQARQEKVIISITSFPARMETLWMCIESLLRQTYQPDKILLWLSRSQFGGIELPETLTSLCKRGLEIRWVDEDLRSHKKYYYALQEFSNDLVVTFDDDVFYPNNVLESLVKLHQKYPKAVCANRAHWMKTDAQGVLLPYRQWGINAKKVLIPSKHLMAIGIGGVLYPPKSISDEVFNQELFKKICFFADDVWLKACELISGVDVVTSKQFDKEFIVINASQSASLLSTNVFEGGNDKQIKDVLEYYKIKL